MRFLWRLLMLVAVGSYLLGHYGPFIRRQLSDIHLAGSQQPFGRLPAITPNPPVSWSVPALARSGILPRHDLTPGALDPRVNQSNIGSTICRHGYAASVRPPFEFTNAAKHRLMHAYGATGSIHDYELDHLIPLELGGCPDCDVNLWPESRNVFPGAAEKDEVEDYLNHAVCTGAMPLAQAQQEIASDWYAVYQKLHRHPTRRPSKKEE